MLDIYKLGRFREVDFSDKFAHAANATTPENLIPLALVPLTPEEIELRKNSTLGPMQQQGGGRGGGRGFQDREAGRGKGRGRDGEGGKGEGGKGERGKGRSDGEQWNRGERYSNDRQDGRGERGERGDRRNERSGDVRNHDRRDPRDSNGSDDGGRVPATPPLPNMPAPPPAKDWFYRDLEQNVQGPFTEAQISEWHTAGYLPADLQMRAADEPEGQYIPLSELMQRYEGEPPFLKARPLPAPRPPRPAAPAVPRPSAPRPPSPPLAPPLPRPPARPLARSAPQRLWRHHRRRPWSQARHTTDRRPIPPRPSARCTASGCSTRRSASGSRRSGSR